MPAPRLTYLRIRNYRALHDVEFRDLTPLTVLVGPNGSGKSTVLDALAFLAEAVGGNLVQAWEKRDRFRGMRTRGNEEPIEFTVEFTYPANRPQVLRYEVAFSESTGTVVVTDEVLSLASAGGYRVFHTFPTRPRPPDDERLRVNSYGSDLHSHDFASPTSSPLLGRLSFFPDKYTELWFDVMQAASFLQDYRYIHLTDLHNKGISDAGPRERLSANGDNLPNVLYHLQEKHPAVLQAIVGELKAQVPALGDVLTEMTSDERLLLRFRDQAFEKPLPAHYVSDGTLRLAALLTLLHEPHATGLLGLEEPENELHPRLLPGLAETLLRASETRQLLVATHAPALLNALEPEQVWVLHRGPDGYTRATHAADLPGIASLVAEGSPLGYLWQSNFFDVGDPLAGTGQTAPADAA